MSTEKLDRIRVTGRALLILYLYRAGAAVVIGYPVARTLGALGPTAHPDGDMALFAPSGVHLMEALRVGARAIPASLESASLLTVLIAILGLFPLAAALADLENPGATRGQLCTRAADRLPSFLFLSGALVLSQAGLAVIVMLVVKGTSALTDSLRNERTADLVPLLVGLVGALGVTAIGVAGDVARAAVMRHGARGMDSLRIAARTLAAAPRAVATRFFAPLVATGLIVTAGALVTAALDVARPGAWRIAGVFFVHQLAVVAIVLFRLRALGAALELVEPYGARGGVESPDPKSPVFSE